MARGSTGNRPLLSRFAHNVLCFQKRIGAIYYPIAVTPSEGYEFCRTERDELNLRRVEHGRSFYYHSQEGALEEAQRHFASLNLDNRLLIYHGGVGLGYFYLAARSWLEEESNRYLLFLESDSALWHYFLQSELATEILENPQVYLCPLGFEQAAEQLSEIAVYFSRLPFITTLLPAYEALKERWWPTALQDLAMLSEMQGILGGQQLELNRAVYENYYANLGRLEEVLEGSRLFGRFEGVPAVICGAGPSLQHALPFLEQLKERALVIAAGSAFTALTSADITPHMAAGLCPDKGEVERFWHQTGYQVPFVYRSRLNKEALRCIHGPLIYTPGCAGAWQLAAWVEEQLGLEGESMEEGPSIFYMSCEWARRLGCNPILFVGLDLALEGGCDYAEGVRHGSERLQREFEEVAMEDIHGRPIVTYRKWVYESRVLAHLVHHHPEVRYINASDAGIGVSGAENIPLKEGIVDGLGGKRDLQGRLHAELLGAQPPHISRERIEAVVSVLRKSTERAILMLEEIMEEQRRVEGKIVAEAVASFRKPKPLASTVEPWIANGHLALLWRELEEELIFKLVLEVMLEQRKRYLARLYDRFQAPPIRLIYGHWKRELALQQEHALFLHTAACEHLELLSHA